MSNLRVQVRGGTAVGGASLCPSCRYAHIVRMADTNEEVVRCAQLEGDTVIRGRVAECNKYVNGAAPTLDAMKQIAWPITLDKKGVAGFMTPKEYQQARREGKVGDDELLVLPDGELHW